MTSAGPFRARVRRGAIAAAIAAIAAVSGIAGSADAGSAGGAPARAALAPPTAAEVREATREFLSRHRDADPDEVRPRAGAGPPRPGREIFPSQRVVSFYGAPQLTATVVGRNSPAEAGRKLLDQAAAYEGPNRRPVIPAIDLIGVIATASAGSDGKYRTRQSSQIIDTYLARARRIGARLMLDIQPGRANVLRELKALRRYVVQPDLDLAIDPEWNVGPRGVPGRTRGSITARKLNRFSKRMQRLIKRRGLPPKVLVVHQFHSRSVRKRNRVRQRPRVAVTLNFDGIGSPAAKRAGYVDLRARRTHDGFSIFYSRDRPLMRPRDVLALEPEPDFVLYQ
ncbi:MAG TPA: hypothetical protein VK919_11100 [Solirubrobacterales bacterium]|nr:hypothetical protein [Solirubrobacterales bacterium]